MTNLLYATEVPINDNIIIHIPTVGEVIEKETSYYVAINMLTATPYDYMVELDDMGVRFTDIDDYELFIFVLFPVLQEMDTSLVLGELDLKLFNVEFREDINQFILYDRSHDIVIDRVIHGKISNVLRKVHHIEPNTKRPGNDAALEYMIKRARKKRKRKKKDAVDSQLEQLIVAMVNTEQYKYGYEGTRELSIYQFNESVQQIQHKVNYEHTMHGIYAGTVDPAKLSQKDLNWLCYS
jgi:hypothetical protein